MAIMSCCAEAKSVPTYRRLPLLLLEPADASRFAFGLCAVGFAVGRAAVAREVAREVVRLPLLDLVPVLGAALLFQLPAVRDCFTASALRAGP